MFHRYCQIRRFQLPPNYKPNGRIVRSLPFKTRLEIWWKSLSPHRLRQIQHQLIELLFSSAIEENSNIKRTFQQIPIDTAGNVINELTLTVINDRNAPTRHVVFLHGYGASLGCYARNFHVINSFKGCKNNYTFHFLDNLSFGLSSNPKIKSLNYWRPIPQLKHVSFKDTTPTEPKKLYRKYYKLVDSYDFDREKFKKSKDSLKPLLQEIESYYVDALEQWRINSNISKIHTLVGHSFGGYWSSCYSLKYADNLQNLVLLSPVGVERTPHSVTCPIPEKTSDLQPSLDSTSYNFLSRFPILSKRLILKWYFVQPYLPRLLKFMGPFGVSKYYDMWYSKLFAINKVIEKLGGSQVFSSQNELVYGSNTECRLIIEYLYNSITTGTNSDIHIKYLLTPATTSKWPLYDKFVDAPKSSLSKFNIHFVYGQYDFMNSEAAENLVQLLSPQISSEIRFHIVPQGGHNLYIQNPFDTNKLLVKLLQPE